MGVELGNPTARFTSEKRRIVRASRPGWPTDSRGRNYSKFTWGPNGERIPVADGVRSSANTVESEGQEFSDAELKDIEV